MAIIVRDHRETRRARAPIPHLKPPVNRFSSQDMEHPEEADDFIALVRDLRRILRVIHPRIPGDGPPSRYRTRSQFLFKPAHPLYQEAYGITVGNHLVISFMTLAELSVWPIRNNWGGERRALLKNFIALYTPLFAGRNHLPALGRHFGGEPRSGATDGDSRYMDRGVCSPMGNGFGNGELQRFRAYLRRDAGTNRALITRLRQETCRNYFAGFHTFGGHRARHSER